MLNTKVKFVDDGTDFSQPVEPELLSLLARERLDELMTHPTPSVLDALRQQSTTLYDLGIRAGMDWRRRSLNDVSNPLNNAEIHQYNKMLSLLNHTRAHTTDCKHLAYAEGWIAGWSSLPQLEGRQDYVAPNFAHHVNRGAY